MMRFLTPSRPSSDRGFAYRLGWWIGRLIIWFVAGSMGLTVPYKFVPVPVTITMVLDPNGFEKSWTLLSRIDRNMVDAVICCSITRSDRAQQQPSPTTSVANSGKPAAMPLPRLIGSAESSTDWAAKP